MRPGREAPYSDVQVVGVTFGVPGKLQVNRSSVLENSVHSCASTVPGIDRINTAAMIRIRLMMVLRECLRCLLPGPTKAGLYWHRAAPLPSVPPLSRYTMWQFAQAVFSLSLISTKASKFLAFDAVYATLPIATRSATYCL